MALNLKTILMFQLQFTLPTKSFMIHSNSISTLSRLIVEPDWNYIPYYDYFPDYDRNEIFLGSNNNCVSYALRSLIPSLSTTYESSVGIVPELFRPYYLTPKNIIRSFSNVLNSYNVSLTPIQRFDDCTHNGFRICIVLDNFNYYHFLRQNSDGMWSHFLINSGVSNIDSLGRQIIDPEKATICNFSYENVTINGEIFGPETPFNITSFIGYFMANEVNQ